LPDVLVEHIHSLRTRAEIEQLTEWPASIWMFGAMLPRPFPGSLFPGGFGVIPPTTILDHFRLDQTANDLLAQGMML
jgi:hypothetical protein